jgi:hypothetical protein
MLLLTFSVHATFPEIEHADPLGRSGWAHLWRSTGSG